MDVICRRYLVAGRVQGVFYRATAARHARELQIFGHAKNLPDGRVEVLAYGEDEALREFVNRLWIGSTASKVISVETEESSLAPPLPTRFTTV